jgi:hypothetical protein
LRSIDYSNVNLEIRQRLDKDEDKIKDMDGLSIAGSKNRNPSAVRRLLINADLDMIRTADSHRSKVKLIALWGLLGFLFQYYFACLRLRIGTNKIPATNPPMCAHQAIPPEVSIPSVWMPLKNCIRNQNPMNKKADISMMSKKKKIGMRVTTFARGNITRYAPRTPEIAPLAPIVGTDDCGPEATWMKAAASPLKT